MKQSKPQLSYRSASVDVEAAPAEVNQALMAVNQQRRSLNRGWLGAGCTSLS